jgi:translocation and assembly module TamA
MRVSVFDNEFGRKTSVETPVRIRDNSAGLSACIHAGEAVIRLCRIIALAIVLALPSAAGAVVRSICQGYQVDSPKPLRLNKNEKKLVCGDPNTAAWQEIPAFQAKHFLRIFLQQRGYSSPEFREEEGMITIIPGPQARILRIEVEGDKPKWFHVWRKRQIRGTVLTPGALSTLEDWAVAELKARGYPCPTVTSTADAATGVVTLRLAPGEQEKIAEVVEEPVEGLRPGTLRRFDAFRVGDPYDVRNLSITENRIAYDSLLQSSHFQTECTPEGAALRQKSVTGPTRLFSIGLGANSEDYFVVKGAWKLAKLGQNGSSFQVAGWASYRKQYLNLKGFVYPLPFPSRWYVEPSILTQHVYESRYNYLSMDLFLPPAVTWESAGAHFHASMGPKVNYTRTFSGADSGSTHFLSLSFRLDVTSHEYEYHLLNPQSGYFLSASADLSSDKVLSSVTAQQFRLQGEGYWNIAGLSPPLFIMGVRGFAGTTLTDMNASSFSRLPPQFFSYLGGSRNMRGFELVELPKASRGALTALYTGLELRMANIFPLNLQPMAFIDVGVLGQDELSLDLPVYWSPGLGMRWPSPIGVVRITAAHGYLARNHNPANDGVGGWTFYFALGEEF